MYKHPFEEVLLDSDLSFAYEVDKIKKDQRQVLYIENGK